MLAHRDAADTQPCRERLAYDGAALRQVEEARTGETDKWIAFYDADSTAEKARLALLRQTGELTAALR